MWMGETFVKKGGGHVDRRTVLSVVDIFSVSQQIPVFLIHHRPLLGYV